MRTPMLVGTTSAYLQFCFSSIFMKSTRFCQTRPRVNHALDAFLLIKPRRSTILTAMADYEIVRLANGVHSVRSKAENETFHPVVGPVQEARDLYVEQLRLPQRIAASNRPFVIWDVGLGAAANVLTVIDESRDADAKLHVVSFEYTLQPREFALMHAEHLGYPLLFKSEIFELIRNRRSTSRHGKLEVNWEVHVADYPTLISSDAARSWPKPDAILFDAFSPAKNPAMWTLPLFSRMHQLLDPQRPCAMPTYSRSTMLRVTLLLAGFFVGVGRAIAEKEETTIAANNLSLIDSPLPASWLKRARNSTCAEPLVEPVYTRHRLSESSWQKLQAHRQFNT